MLLKEKILNRIVIKSLLTVVILILSNQTFAQNMGEDLVDSPWDRSEINVSYNNDYFFDNSKMNEQEWIDSIFNTNFNIMKSAIKNNMMDDTLVDRFFTYLVSYMSGTDCSSIDSSNFCFFDYDTLKHWKKWFEKYRKQISAESVVWGLNFLKNGNKTQEGWDKLHNFKIP